VKAIVKIRTKFNKADEVKFISHLDLMNSLTRTLRRAKIPIKFSQGYNPRPLISFGAALAVGITSSNEYADFEMEEYPVDKFKDDFNDELPTGIEIIQVEEIPVRTKSLMAQINAAKYEIDLKFTEQITEEKLDKFLEDFMSKEKVMVVRKRRNKSDRKFNLRPMVFSLKLVKVIGEQEAVIETVIQTGSSGNLRPQELIRSLQRGIPISSEFNLTDIHRSGLYTRKDKKLFTPFEVI
jgi:radical SAM-linked protein